MSLNKGSRGFRASESRKDIFSKCQKFRINARSLIHFFIIWILSVLIFVASSTTHREYEEKFVELYGNDNDTSGTWEPVRNTWPNLLPLYNYTHYIHDTAGMQPTGEMRMVLLQKRTLMFKFSPQYSNMSIDLLVYGVKDHFKYKTVPYWYYITKGLQPDCVFYLAEEDDNQDFFSLYSHVCGIQVFNAEPSNETISTRKPYIWPWQVSLCECSSHKFFAASATLEQFPTILKFFSSLMELLQSLLDPRHERLAVVSRFEIKFFSQVYRRSQLKIMHSFIISCISRSFLLWLLSSTFEWPEAKTTINEESFFIFYGNQITSGIWGRLFNIQDDIEALKYVCSQAHNKTHQGIPGEVKIYGCDKKKLIFSNREYTPTDMDVIIYSIEGCNKDDGSPYYYYIGKGLFPNCVFYLKPKDRDERTFILGDHVCGIDV